MNEKMQHTPGQWHVGGEWPQVVAVYDDNSVYIAHADTGIGRDWVIQNPIGLERARANAHLIAAAPDMLKALREIMADTVNLEPAYCCDLLPETRQLIRASIAKATGQANLGEQQHG